MHLNPFLRAFFRSTLPAQCTPVHNHILLVPTTETLLNSRDRESGALYSELAGSEEFLGSHVLRLPGSALSNGVKDTGNVRDSRGKAKQYTTINGRTVVVKDAFVYSNKGFKNLNTSQLLNDIVFYPDTLEAPQWVIYFIAKPLVGALEAVSLPPAAPNMSSRSIQPESITSANVSAPAPAKREVKTFNDLLNNFPMIARQMQAGLEQVFRDFAHSLEAPAPHQAAEEDSGPAGSQASPHQPGGTASNGHIHIPHAPEPAFSNLRDESDLRLALETAVTAAIDLFQMVDKQQLSFLGASTELTGPLVERLIERYVTEQVHDAVVFPTMCAIKRSEDQELDYRIRQMESVDISQVGIAIQGGIEGKRELTLRLQKAVGAFRKLGVAGSPQEMVEILLDTERIVTMTTSGPANATAASEARSPAGLIEKPTTALTMNADALVSLLLIVVIRSQVRHLQARLSYMRHFIFLDDAEGGEIGYALSTFEAVLAYLAKDSGGLRKASRRNKALWQATRDGDIQEMRAILEPHRVLLDEDTEVVLEPDDFDSIDDVPRLESSAVRFEDLAGLETPTVDRNVDISEGSSLSHVFPFQSRNHIAFEDPTEHARRRKRVSMDTGSMSSSSVFSVGSMAMTIDSRGSGIEGDTSIERLSKTQDAAGDSLPMMAVESHQPDALKYLLTLDDYFTLESILQDVNNQGTTLLSAAIQLGHSDSIEIVLDFILRADDDRFIAAYLQKQDHNGRTAAHYLFNASHLIQRLGRLIAWRLKDKNGQTPLFALCRSYDHARYREMIQEALTEAHATQRDGLALHLDDHVDAKGNTLLHIANDPVLAAQLMAHCDVDVNATNDKKFTALMVASKYGRVDMVRTFFADPRVDVCARDHRGLTAVELAKDDEIRNRIDDLVLLSGPAALDGRTTAVVRSFFVEDATIRLVLKSAAPSSKTTITITTCRRSLLDFENLAKWLAIEHPASWLPPLSNKRSPFQLPSKPSRAVLRDVQQRLDAFLRVLLNHSTFSSHEMLWEFFLAPEIQPEMMAERSRKKAEMRLEMVREEYDPVEDVRGVEDFVGHARDTIRAVNHATKAVTRWVNQLHNNTEDLHTSYHLLNSTLATLTFPPTTHLRAFALFAATPASPSQPPLVSLHYALLSILTTLSSLLTSLARPTALIASLNTTSASIAKHLLSLQRSNRWPLGLLDDTRSRLHAEAAAKVDKGREEMAMLGRELRYSQQVVAGELAEWQDLHARMGRRALRDFARGMVTRERERLGGMGRALRALKRDDPTPPTGLSSETEAESD